MGGGGVGVGGRGSGGFGGRSGACAAEAGAGGGGIGEAGRLGGYFPDLGGMCEVHAWGAFFDLESMTMTLSFVARDLYLLINLTSSGLIDGCGGGGGLLAGAIALCFGFKEMC